MTTSKYGERRRPIGFIGGGCDSAVGYVHAAACQMDGHWQIASGCFSKRADQNVETGHYWGVSESRVYESWKALIEKERGRLSAVAVLVPTPDHTEIVCAALKNGFSVICEKALATSTTEAKRIHAAQVESKSFLGITYNYSGYPMVRELRNCILAGKLGKILQVQVEMPQEGFLRTDHRGKPVQPQPWRLQDYEIPTVSLDLGTHVHHLVRFLTGCAPVEVMADHRTYGNFPGVVDDVSCWVNYSDGMRASIWFSKAAIGHRNGLRVRVFGDKGSAEWHQIYPEELRINHTSGIREIIDPGGPCEVACEPRYTRFKAGHPAGFIEAFANLYSDIATSLDEWTTKGKTTSPFVPQFSDALEGLELFEAAKRSAANKQWEAVRL